MNKHSHDTNLGGSNIPPLAATRNVAWMVSWCAGGMLAAGLVFAKNPDRPEEKEPSPHALGLADILDTKGDGPDGQGNTADDTWQFLFSIAHKTSEFQPLKLHTSTMTPQQRSKGIPRKVSGPIAGFLPNPDETDGWIYHRDWDGRFEGIWADKKLGKIYAHPYTESGGHYAVAIAYRVAETGTYNIIGKITDDDITPDIKRHDGILWSVEKVQVGGKSTVLKRGGPIGEGRGNPSAAEFRMESVELEKGQQVRLVIHPNRWWGGDRTWINDFRVEPMASNSN